MKHILFVSALLVTTWAGGYGQKLVPAVDRRVEIMSIVARLAGYEEYSQPHAKTYVAAILSHFKAYQDDTLVAYAKKLREPDDGIGFDAVMNMAVHLEGEGGNFRLKEGWRSGIDKRWIGETAPQFVTLLNRFYNRSDANAFFSSQKEYYDKSLRAFRAVLADFRQEWYERYYGTPPSEKFNIIVGLGNGGSNYGPSSFSLKEGKQVYAIMGSWTFDAAGDAQFNATDYLPTLVHEFNHSFINPLLTKHEQNIQLKQSAQTLLDSTKTEMNAMGYGDWNTLINESLVRASVIRYLSAAGADSSVALALQLEKTSGFLWINELAQALAEYEKNREKYPTLDKYYTELIGFFVNTAHHIQALRAEYELNRPSVASTVPFNNGAAEVDPSLTEMKIYFDQPLAGKGSSIKPDPSGKAAYPVKAVTGYTDDNRAFTIELQLEPNRDYAFIVNGSGRSFRNREGYPLKIYTVKFRTRAAP